MAKSAVTLMPLDKHLQVVRSRMPGNTLLGSAQHSIPSGAFTPSHQASQPRTTFPRARRSLGVNPLAMSQKLPDAGGTRSRMEAKLATAVPTTGFSANTAILKAGSLAAKIVKRLSPEQLRQVRQGDVEPCRQLRFFMQYSDSVAA